MKEFKIDGQFLVGTNAGGQCLAVWSARKGSYAKLALLFGHLPRQRIDLALQIAHAGRIFGQEFAQGRHPGFGIRQFTLNAAQQDILCLNRPARVDILFMHQFDERTPLEEIVRGLEDLVRSGKVLYPAVSNYSAWQAQKTLAIQEINRFSRIEVVEPMYNLVKRQAEVEILPMALANDLAVIPYSPVAGGLLSGKYLAGSGANSGRLRTNKMYGRRYSDAWAATTAGDLVSFCEEHGLHPVSAAVAWVGSHPAVTAPIIGARNLDQLRPSLDSIKIDMTEELRAALSDLSPEPPPATDRLEVQLKD